MHHFTTERLLIRPLSKEDRALFINLYTDAKVMRNIGRVMNHDKAEKAFNNTLKIMKKTQPNIMTWAIIDLDENKTIGIQGFTWPTASDPSADKDRVTADIGIILLRSSNGRLFPEEAMGALMEYGFTYLKLEKINASYASKNLATKRFVKKLGFVYSYALKDVTTNNSYQYVDKSRYQQKHICKVS